MNPLINYSALFINNGGVESFFMLFSEICNIKNKNPKEKSTTDFSVVTKFTWNYCLVLGNVKSEDCDF